MTPAPSRAHWGVRALQLPIKAYQLLLSPMLGTSCRYFPSCSAYAVQALEDHGVWRGSYLAAHRICRCGPWGAGGVDEVPPPKPTRRAFSCLLHSSNGSGRDSAT